MLSLIQEKDQENIMNPENQEKPENKENQIQIKKNREIREEVEEEIKRLCM
jgi:hypothetical protein